MSTVQGKLERENGEVIFEGFIELEESPEASGPWGGRMTVPQKLRRALTADSEVVVVLDDGRVGTAAVEEQTAIRGGRGYMSISFAGRGPLKPGIDERLLGDA